MSVRGISSSLTSESAGPTPIVGIAKESHQPVVSKSTVTSYPYPSPHLRLGNNRGPHTLFKKLQTGLAASG